MLVVFALLFAIASRGHNDFCSALLEAFEKLFGIITFVSPENLEVEIFDKLIGLRLVVTLTSRQQKSQRIAQSIYSDMHFC